MHVDFGTGDGAFVRFTAAAQADVLVIGVDAVADSLREVSRRVATKPARGGLGNALFGRLGLDQAPGALAGLADRLTVLLPWGSLLQAVAQPRVDQLRRLRALCRGRAALRVVFGYGHDRDGAAIRDLGLPDLEDGAARSALEAAFGEAGFAVGARVIEPDEVRSLPTSWAKRLAFSARVRRFVAVEGHAQG